MQIFSRTVPFKNPSINIQDSRLMICTLCPCMPDLTFKSGFLRSFEEASWSWSGLVWGGEDLVTICRPTQRISLSRQIIIIIVILIIILIITLILVIILILIIIVILIITIIILIIIMTVCQT